MRDKRSPRGKLFSFKPIGEWGDELTQQVQLSSQYRCHMVLVLGKALTRPPGWVRIVNVCMRYSHIFRVFSDQRLGYFDATANC